MRQIKFRIWNASGNNMLYDIENVYECLMQQLAFDKAQPSRQFATAYDHRSEGMVWMQFTGLLDKNGMEIYEGDLIAEINEPSELGKWGNPLTVMFGEFIGNKDSWGMHDCTIGFYLKYREAGMTGISDKVDCYGFRGKDLLVIGNIYENPHLLK